MLLYKEEIFLKVLDKPRGLWYNMTMQIHRFADGWAYRAFSLPEEGFFGEAVPWRIS